MSPGNLQFSGPEILVVQSTAIVVDDVIIRWKIIGYTIEAKPKLSTKYKKGFLFFFDIIQIFRQMQSNNQLVFDEIFFSWDVLAIYTGGGGV